MLPLNCFQLLNIIPHSKQSNNSCCCRKSHMCPLIIFSVIELNLIKFMIYFRYFIIIYVPHNHTKQNKQQLWQILSFILQFPSG